jgi:hypothetical protein
MFNIFKLGKGLPVSKNYSNTQLLRFLINIWIRPLHIAE